MSKHKTRQQKIITQLQRKLETQQSSAVSYKPDHITYAYKASLPTSTSSIQSSTAISYIKHDLIKTSLVTSFIIAAQLLLYISLKTHMITLPIIGY
jgi:hypothetical protein